MTLNEILEKHPEYGDLQVVVYSVDGAYHYVDGPWGLGAMYKAHDEEEGIDVLVFAPN